MKPERVTRLAVLVLAAGCANQGRGGRLPQVHAGDAVPQASLRVEYSSDQVLRTVNAWFRVDRTAFVLVGHLGGDGVIRVIYPEFPRNFGRSIVRAGATVETQPFYAGYDGDPSLYSFSVAPVRTASAMTDSYDGRGHGFVFLVAMTKPMNFAPYIDDGRWIDVDVRNYATLSDPRSAIREYANVLARGEAYTLKFATSASTRTLASSRWKCSTLASGLYMTSSFWGNWGLADLLTAEYHSRIAYGRSECDPLSLAYLRTPYGITEVGYRPPVPAAPVTGPTSPAPRRPTYRAFGERAAPTLADEPRVRIPTTRRPGVDQTAPSRSSDDDLLRHVPASAPIHRAMEESRSYTPPVSAPPVTAPPVTAPPATAPPPLDPRPTTIAPTTPPVVRPPNQG